MAAGSRCRRLRSPLYPGQDRTTLERALALTKRLAEGAAIRCPGRFAAVPGGVSPLNPRRDLPSTEGTGWPRAAAADD